MLVATTVGVLDSMPDGELARMGESIGLASVGGIPEVGLVMAVDHSRASHDVPTIAGEEQPSVLWLLMQLEEECISGYVALGLEPVVLAHQAHVLLEIIVALHLVSDDATLIGIIDAMLQGGRDALLGRA